jgi:flagellar hook-basal body complex protein FliE
MGLDPLTAVRAFPLQPLRERTVTGTAKANQGESGFGGLVARAVEQLDALQKQADLAAVQVARGENTELHEALLTMEEAGLALQLAIQVRNKLVEAYQEIMRMQV